MLAGVSTIISLVCGLGLIFLFDAVNQVWPWVLTPLVGGLIGVLFLTHTAAYAWVQWDGDWLRVRPMFWQAPITGLLLIFLPVVHTGDLRPDAGLKMALYFTLAGFMVLANLAIILRYRGAEKGLATDVQ